MAWLVEWLPLTHEICSLNPTIGKNSLLPTNCTEKMKVSKGRKGSSYFEKSYRNCDDNENPFFFLFHQQGKQECFLLLEITNILK